MKLYYSPGACSQAPHILIHELGLSHEVVKVDLKSHTLADGSDYYAINPKGSVPALQLESGDVLTENAVILQFLGDRSSLGDVLPPLGQFRRYRVLEWVNFITTEIHKSFSPLFSPDAGDATKSFFRDKIGHKFDYVDQELGQGPFLMGEDLTLPDPYLFVMLGWAEKMIGLDRWPSLVGFRERMLERPSVRDVLSFEGLLEKQAAG